MKEIISNETHSISEDARETQKTNKKVAKINSTKKKNAIVELLGYAGKRKAFAYIGCVLSAFNAVLTMMPFV